MAERIPKYNDDNNRKELICIQMIFPKTIKRKIPLSEIVSNNKLLILSRQGNPCPLIPSVR